MKRFKVWISVLAVLAAFALFLARPGTERVRAGERSGATGATPAPVVAVQQVVEAEDIATRRYTGHIVSVSAVDLMARVPGEILRVRFKEGEAVSRGDILYELDAVQYEAAVKNAEAKLKESEARLAYARNSFERSNNLYRQNAASKDSMEVSLSEQDSAEAQVLAAKASLIAANDNLKNTIITAPLSGKIGITNFSAGNYVTAASGPLATIIQTNPIRVSFAISTRDFLSMFGTESMLRETGLLRIRLADDSIYALPGRVELLDNHADRRSDTMIVYALFDNPDGVLMPGGTVTVSLSRKNEGRLSAVPPSAVMFDANGAYVYVVAGDTVERRDVRLGPTNGELQLVYTGVEARDVVIVEGTHKAKPGNRVETVFVG